MASCGYPYYVAGSVKERDMLLCTPAGVVRDPAFFAGAKGVEMPIVSQVAEVLAGTLNPRDLAPHLTTDTVEPQGE